MNYSEIIIRNLVNNLKLLTLNSNQETSHLNYSNEIHNDSNKWDTCNETFSKNNKKLYLNFKLKTNKTANYNEFNGRNYTNYEQYLAFLDKVDPKNILEEIQIIIGYFDEFAVKPEIILQKLNKILFDNCVFGLKVRWGNCKK